MKAFISHSSIDKPFVERLATDLLTREGIDAWLDKWEINNAAIPEKIEDRLSSTEIFILVLSPDSVKSRWVSLERQTWQTLQIEEEKIEKKESRPPKRQLIPVLYKDCEKPPFIKPLLHISINEQNYEEGFQQLVKRIRGDSGKPPLKGETTVAPVPSSRTGQCSENELPERPEELALERLLRLRPPQFKRVIFYYKLINEYDLPDANAPQSEKATEFVRLAVQQEGESLSKLFSAIDKAMKR